MNKLLDRLGDLNPQLLREIKGKLKGRNIARYLIICDLSNGKGSV